MTQRTKPFFFSLALHCLLVFGVMTIISPAGNRKQAYKHHYEGTLHYKAEAYRKANHAFGQAYRALLENFFFAMAYGLSLARVGQARRSSEVLSIADASLRPVDEDFPLKKGLVHFFQGMGLAYSKNYGLAFQAFRRAL